MLRICSAYALGLILEWSERSLWSIADNIRWLFREGREGGSEWEVYRLGHALKVRGL